MAERPILFNGPMVRAIRAGQKTVTRRAVKGMALEWLGHFAPSYVASPGNGFCPYGQPGDRLWVRETFAIYGDEKMHVIHYRADRPDHVGQKGFGYKPSIHMPRWVCRILLEVTAVHIERLQNISAEQAQAEGCYPIVDGEHTCYANHLPAPAKGRACDAVTAFQLLWDYVGGNWDGNPWVWVVEFKQVTP
jgi:hypothetical protein